MLEKSSNVSDDDSQNYKWKKKKSFPEFFSIEVVELNGSGVFGTACDFTGRKIFSSGR